MPLEKPDSFSAMGKKTDDKKTKKALARVRRTLRKKDTLQGEAALSEWEDEFTRSLEERLEKFGSAFADPQKGEASEALSRLQAIKLREVERKAAGKTRKPMRRGRFKPKKGFSQKPADLSAGQDRDTTASEDQDQSRQTAYPPRLRVISGGKQEP